MRTNRVYLECFLTKQMLTEATHEDWSGASITEVSAAAPSLRNFISNWKETCADTAQIEALLQRIDANLGNLFDNDVRSSNPPLLRYQGHLLGPFGSVCRSFDISSDNGTVHITVDDMTRFQKYYFTENEMIHIYASPAGEARYIITEDTYHTLRYTYGEDIKERFISDYLTMSHVEQSIVNAIARKEDIRRSVLYAMAYCASALMYRKNGLNAAEFELIGNEYNTEIAPRMGCIYIPLSWYVNCAEALFAQGTDRDLALYAVVNGCSAWHTVEKSTSAVLLEFANKNSLWGARKQILALVAADRIQPLLDDLLAMKPKTAAESDAVDACLFALLTYHKGLTRTQVETISQALFHHSIRMDEISNMHNLLNGPNGKTFRAFIMDSFYHGSYEGIAQYHFCAAAIVNIDRAVNKKNPIDCAIDEMGSAQTQVDFLLNSLCLGMIGWFPTVYMHNYQNQIINTKLSDSLIEDLTSSLLIPDKLAFPIAAGVVHDLIIARVLDEHVITENMILSAIESLNADDTRRRAEELLSLSPFLVAEQSYTKSSTCNALAEAYRHRFETSLKDSDCADAPEVLFAALCHVDAWDTNVSRWEALKRICAYYSKYSKWVSNETRIRMNKYLSHFAPHPRLWTMHNTGVEPIELGRALSEDERQAISALRTTLSAEGAPTHRVCDVHEAIRLIKYLAPYEQPALRYTDPGASALVKKIRLDIPDAGSYITVSWFRFLCVFGYEKLALEFYREHKNVLDLPHYVASMRPSSTGTLDFGECRRYLSSTKRIEAAIVRAVQAGHFSILSAFMESEFRDIVDCQRFVNSLLIRFNGNTPKTIADIYDGRYGLTVARSEHVAAEKFRSDDLDNLICRLKLKLDSRNESCGHDAADYEIDGEATKSSLQSEVDSSVHADTPVHYVDTWTPSDEESARYSPHLFFDDRAVLEFNLAQYPKRRTAVLQLGYGNDYDLVMLAVAHAGESLQFASPALKEDDRICLCALQNSGYALPFVKSGILHDFSTVKKLLLKGNFTLHGIPEPYLSDRDIITAAVRRDPSELRYAPPWAKADRAIVKEALQQSRRSNSDTLAVMYIDDTLTDDKELMLIAIRANPGAYTYVSERLRKDPDILALPRTGILSELLDLESFWDGMK